MLPTIILNMNVMSLLLYGGYRVLESTEAHSGYILPISVLGPLKYLPGHWNQDRHHNYHHSHNDGCYSFWFVDALFGTNKRFEKYYFDQMKKKIQ